MLLSKASKLFLIARSSERLSPHTIADYSNTYRRFQSTIGDLPIHQITPDDIRRFMASTTDVSRKTALNYHVGLSSLWNWLVKTGCASTNIIRLVTPPKPELRQIIPFTRQDLLRLIDAAIQGDQTLRDRAILLTLLDTGVRSSELCTINEQDLDFTTGMARVIGKGLRERTVVLSQPTMKAIQNYLTTRQRSNPASPLFVTSQGAVFKRDSLRQILERLGARGGVPHTHAHRFRHTFAIQFLRNGGNVFTLQLLLGHSSLDMVKRYLAIARTDLLADHLKASPVVCWDLETGSGP